VETYYKRLTPEEKQRNSEFYQQCLEFDARYMLEHWNLAERKARQEEDGMVD